MKWMFCKTQDITEEEYQSIYKNLSPSRKAHIDSIKREEARLRSLAATVLLTRLLKEAGIMGAVIETDKNGKPYLLGGEAFISLSHSENGIAVAVSDTPVGIDVEKIKPISQKLIDYVCNEKEKEYILNQDDKDYAFLSVWTTKEAVFKKSNCGIKNLRDIDTTSVSKQTFKGEGFVITVII